MITFPGNRHELLRYFPKDSVCAEIGVASGDYSSVILSLTAPRKLILIDAWENQPESVYLDGNNVPQNRQDARYAEVLRRFEPQRKSGQVDVRRGYSCDEMAKIPAATLDWLYVDANHSFPTALADLNEAYRIVKPGGLISGHDYCYSIMNNRHCGVIPAVMSFLNAHEDLELLCLTAGRWPSYVLGPRGGSFPA